MIARQGIFGGLHRENNCVGAKVGARLQG